MAWVSWTSISTGDIVHDEPLEECRDNLDWIYADIGINRDAGSCGADWPAYWPVKGQSGYGTAAYVVSGAESNAQFSGLRLVANWGWDNRCEPHNAVENSDENVETCSSTEATTCSSTDAATNTGYCSSTDATTNTGYCSSTDATTNTGYCSSTDAATNTGYCSSTDAATRSGHCSVTDAATNSVN